MPQHESVIRHEPQSHDVFTRFMGWAAGRLSALYRKLFRRQEKVRLKSAQKAHSKKQVDVRPPEARGLTELSFHRTLDSDEASAARPSPEKEETPLPAAPPVESKLHFEDDDDAGSGKKKKKKRKRFFFFG